MNIAELVDSLDKALVEKTDKYIKLQEEFNGYRGIVLDEENTKKVNGLLMEIQYAFQEIFPAFYFIGHRIESANNFVNGYESFINDLKKSGCVDMKVEEA